MMEPSNDILFYEKQTFNQFWVWRILGVLLIGLLAYQFYHLFRDWDQMSNGERWTSGLVMALVSICYLLLFTLRLETKITKHQICVRYFPFHLTYKRYHWKDIAQAYTRTYKPLSEYGGWGLRGIGKKKAFNVSGNVGLQLVFRETKKSLLIGTREAEHIDKCLNQIGVAGQHTDLPK